MRTQGILRCMVMSISSCASWNTGVHGNVYATGTGRGPAESVIVPYFFRRNIMFVLPARPLLLALVLSSAGCANLAAISPGDSAQAVEAFAGAPATVWKNADGSEVWEYPQGVQTFMITIDSDLAVREMQQVLSEEYFSKVHAGMSRDEVRRLLGRPKEIWYFSRRDEEAWVWRYIEVNYRFFNVLFDHTSGMVRTTLRLMTR